MSPPEIIHGSDVIEARLGREASEGMEFTRLFLSLLHSYQTFYHSWLPLYSLVHSAHCIFSRQGTKTPHTSSKVKCQKMAVSVAKCGSYY